MVDFDFLSFVQRRNFGDFPGKYYHVVEFFFKIDIPLWNFRAKGIPRRMACPQHSTCPHPSPSWESITSAFGAFVQYIMKRSFLAKNMHVLLHFEHLKMTSQPLTSFAKVCSFISSKQLLFIQSVPYLTLLQSRCALPYLYH